MAGKSTSSLPAQVTSVDKNANTCDAQSLDGTVTYHDIRLAPGGEQSGFFVAYPKQKSFILISQLGNTWYSSLISEIDSFGFFVTDALSIEAGDNFKCLLNSAGLAFNGGMNGGLILIANLVGKLNALEQRMASHQHTYISPTGPLVSTLDPVSNTALSLTQQSDLEDTKIKH